MPILKFSRPKLLRFKSPQGDDKKSKSCASSSSKLQEKEEEKDSVRRTISGKKLSKQISSANRLASWIRRWSSPVQFHISQVHWCLQRHEVVLELNNDSRMLVPLCGKTVDMRYFAESKKLALTFGVDLIRTALEEFLQENDGCELESIVNANEGELAHLKFDGDDTGPLDFFVGNFFTLNHSVLNHEKYTAAWDRASLVAIDPAKHQAYVDSLTRNMQLGARILLVSTEHPPFAKKGGNFGPPYQLTESDLKSLFEPYFSVHFLYREDRIPPEPTWKTVYGCDWFFETSYLMIRTDVDFKDTSTHEDLPPPQV